MRYFSIVRVSLTVDAVCIPPVWRSSRDTGVGSSAMHCGGHLKSLIDLFLGEPFLNC